MINLAIALHVGLLTAGGILQPEPALLAGAYDLAAVRRSSHVEATIDAGSQAFPEGASIRFDEMLVWYDGRTCDDWRVEAIPDEIVRLDDSNLSDLTLPLLDADTYRPPAQSSLRLTCAGEPLADLRRIDDRVFVMHDPSGALVAVFEQRLAPSEVERLQAQLADMKFLEREATGHMDAATRRALAVYDEYRGADYIFAEGVATQALLDGLHVVEN